MADLRSRSAADSLSFFDKAFRSSRSFSFFRFAGLRKPRSKLHPPQVGERLPAALDQWNSDVCAAAGQHDPAGEHEPVPVLDDADESDPEPSQKC